VLAPPLPSRYHPQGACLCNVGVLRLHIFPACLDLILQYTHAAAEVLVILAELSPQPVQLLVSFLLASLHRLQGCFLLRDSLADLRPGEPTITILLVLDYQASPHTHCPVLALVVSLVSFGI